MVTSNRLERLDKNFLRNILDIIPPSNQMVYDGKDAALVSLHERSKGLLVPALNTFDPLNFLSRLGRRFFHLNSIISLPHNLRTHEAALGLQARVLGDWPESNPL